MAETSIEWTATPRPDGTVAPGYTFNPWIGCTKVAPGCTNCYAEADMDKRRHFAQWGPHGSRVRTSEANWKKPLKWNREAAAAGERRRVFCASLADVFEDWTGPVVSATVPEKKAKCEHCGTASAVTIASHGGQRFAYNEHTQLSRACGRDLDKAPLAGWRWATMNDMRSDLFALIDATPHLDWLLLTKRPENILKMWPKNTLAKTAELWGKRGGRNAGLCRQNVWLGTSISDQKTANANIPELLKCRDLAPVLFVSAEPLLGNVNILLHALCRDCETDIGGTYDRTPEPCDGKCPHLDWLIVGAESGHGARPCRPEWIRSLVKQCADAKVPCFVKQMGANVVTRNDMVEDVFNSLDTGWPDPQVEHHIHGFREDYQGADCRIILRDSKGGDMSEWPEDLRVRQFPKVEVPT